MPLLGLALPLISGVGRTSAQCTVGIGRKPDERQYEIIQHDSDSKNL